MADTILVTGGTGFLGDHLVDLLLRDRTGSTGKPGAVRVLTRRQDPALAARGVDVLVGSILDSQAVRRAVEGCQVVYHLAGLVSRHPDDGPRMMRLHVEGTRVLGHAAAAAKVGRVVLASTSGTIGVSTDEHHVATEEDHAPLEIVRRWPYYLSKVYQEQLALQLHRDLHVDLVVMNPSLLLGPGDRRLSSTGDVRNILDKKVPFVPSGGVSFVDVRDVAAAFPVAAERGRSGERYLLTAANWTLRDFVGKVTRAAGIQGPYFAIPDRLSLMGARVLERVARLRGVEPTMDLQSVEMSQHFWAVDASRAQKELGFVPREPEETLRDTIRYLRRHELGRKADAERDDDALTA
jgi:dihydroflavonol-4-reductase